MDPVAISEEAAAARPWAHTLTIGPPPGVSDEDCGTVHALVEHVPSDQPFPHKIRVPLRPSEEEIDAILAGEPVWLTVCSPFLLPFAVTVGRTV